MNIVLWWYVNDPLGTILTALSFLAVLAMVLIPLAIDRVYGHQTDEELVQQILAEIQAKLNNKSQTNVTDENVHEQRSRNNDAQVVR
jgi:hypothetical protein